MIAPTTIADVRDLLDRARGRLEIAMRGLDEVEQAITRAEDEDDDLGVAAGWARLDRAEAEVGEASRALAALELLERQIAAAPAPFAEA